MLIFGMVVASLFSQVVLLSSYLPHVKGTWSMPGYAPGQFISFNFNNYDDTRAKIVAAAKQCDIDANKPLRHLVVDGLTYPTFVDSFKPYEILWTGLNWPGSSEDQLHFLRYVKSDGLVAACHLLPPNFVPLSRKSGPFCCIKAFESLPME
jgi:hypothetical protein